MKYQIFEKGSRNNQMVYPVTEGFLKSMSSCRLVNPMVGKDHNLQIPNSFSLDSSTKEIVRVRLMVLNGVFPKMFMDKHNPFKDEYRKYMVDTDLPHPLISAGFNVSNPAMMADAVHMDMPTDMPKYCLKWLLSTGANVNGWTDRHINFLESVPNIEENVADGIKHSLKRGFEAKYYFGLARPEEVIKDNLLDEQLANMITAYPEGCPNHPSYPAGHSCAAGGAIRLLIDNFEIDTGYVSQLIHTAYYWGMWRSFAGVHHVIDNIAGLIIGGLGEYMKEEIVEQYTVNSLDKFI